MRYNNECSSADAQSQPFQPLTGPRKRLSWPPGKPFKVLCIDGGGILGLLPCYVIYELENRYLNGTSIVNEFDLIVGTSTGGIIVLALGQQMSIEEVITFYESRGSVLFPNTSIRRKLLKFLRFIVPPYSIEDLEFELLSVFGDKILKTASKPTCITSLEGNSGMPRVFKTPHHPDFYKDQNERIADVALSTAAAPTFFAPSFRNGHAFIDGGVWANNPAMVGVTEALSCFDIKPAQIRLLSLGWGRNVHGMSWWHKLGGKIFLAERVVNYWLHAQSQNALQQASLIIDPPNLVRIDAPRKFRDVELDDVTCAKQVAPSLANRLACEHGDRVAGIFFPNYEGTCPL